MNERKPPRLAIWTLQHGLLRDNEALTGDLIERFKSGQSPVWFWKQVYIAVLLGLWTEIRRHWPHFAYAFAGITFPQLFWKAVDGLPGALHWWALPWPWSQIALEVIRKLAFALMALPVLAVGLTIRREFDWRALFRTALLNLTLITMYKYLLDYLLDVPGLSHQVNSHLVAFTFPSVFLVAVPFCSFLVSAWMGCRSLTPPIRRRA